MLLGDMKTGDQGRVLGFDQGASDYRKRLLSLGITPGATFSVTRVAPLGDPVEIRVRGFALSLRKQEAQVLRVEPLAAADLA
ncbi:FeoA family protein [Rhodospirillum rubrum]|uniref:FeoA n=1 Tax=Rhodospirillum rubrum (strain ATCC 11170 / ATH 1.1.1 / DSM 467 / LMG 4362 / NCIMB 8255 / S1) TaxID=269796 RepID=Q2RRH6_RHORT|nr:FeoA family protein [Rhodospirillum rubrum]ABC23269.1 FeoA [Rhodospirillum rubrum ATCC 11170]AEO49001.1 hypothetical protein F11_12685 [Rhodospirillum rubrum F11]MBK1666256.1 ferrous iron transport protein A [Rhodospirillum rubrum]MBK1677024.1 ferrous iron transport protein A [Rhodospirillum rubrum]MBK5954939.1 ferrous iron transport protein A [Rhodospirillum rubrum]